MSETDDIGVAVAGKKGADAVIVESVGDMAVGK